MDAQLKRGILDICVLAAIRSQDSYGYQIIKDMKPYLDLSESTLYTILKRLEAGKMLTVRMVEHQGRLRKYYHITQLGIERIDEFKEDWKDIEGRSRKPASNMTAIWSCSATGSASAAPSAWTAF